METEAAANSHYDGSQRAGYWPESLAFWRGRRVLVTRGC